MKIKKRLQSGVVVELTPKEQVKEVLQTMTEIRDGFNDDIKQLKATIKNMEKRK